MVTGGALHMKFNKNKIKYFTMTLGFILLLTNQVNAQEQTRFSWSESINKGDIFTWRINSIIEQYENLYNENYTVSTLQTNSTSTQLNVTETSTITITDQTTTHSETTETTTDQGYGINDGIKNGSTISIEVLKDLNTLSLDAPLLNNEEYGDSTPTSSYFDYLIDGETNYILFPVYLMIIPIQVKNGIASNFFEYDLQTNELGDQETWDKSIEDGIYSIAVNDAFCVWGQGLIVRFLMLEPMILHNSSHSASRRATLSAGNIPLRRIIFNQMPVSFNSFNAIFSL